jgi:hypothetical protein
LYINNTTLVYVGLFGYIHVEASMGYFGIFNAEIISLTSLMTLYCGFFAGRSEVGIVNCYGIGNIVASGTTCHIGGMVGWAHNRPPNNSYSMCNITVSGTNCEVGGIVGQNYGRPINNCWSSALLSANATTNLYIGGIVGRNTGNGRTDKCAALNPSLSGQGQTRLSGRIVAHYVYTTSLTNNIAFKDMLNPDNTTIWDNKGLTDLDGEDWTKEQVNADGTLGGRFLPENGWSVQNGKLPGFGSPVPMPEWLKLPKKRNNNTVLMLLME